MYCAFCNDGGALPLSEGSGNDTGICKLCLIGLKKRLAELDKE